MKGLIVKNGSRASYSRSIEGVSVRISISPSAPRYSATIAGELSPEGMAEFESWRDEVIRDAKITVSPEEMHATTLTGARTQWEETKAQFDKFRIAAAAEVKGETMKIGSESIEAEEQRQQAEIERFAALAEAETKFRLVASYADNNGHAIDFNRNEYFSIHNKRINAQFGTEPNDFLISKCINAEAKMIDGALTSLIGVCIAASKSIELSDAEVKSFLDVAEWLQDRLDSGLSEGETGVLLKVL